METVRTRGVLTSVTQIKSRCRRGSDPRSRRDPTADFGCGGGCEPLVCEPQKALITTHLDASRVVDALWQPQLAHHVDVGHQVGVGRRDAGSDEVIPNDTRLGPEMSHLKSEAE